MTKITEKLREKCSAEQFLPKKKLTIDIKWLLYNLAQSIYEVWQFEVDTCYAIISKLWKLVLFAITRLNMAIIVLYRAIELIGPSACSHQPTRTTPLLWNLPTSCAQLPRGDSMAPTAIYLVPEPFLIWPEDIFCGKSSGWERNHWENSPQSSLFWVSTFEHLRMLNRCV